MSLWTVGVAILFGRVYLMYHTEAQVLVGAALGSLAAFVWFVVTQNYLTPLFPALVRSPLGRMLCLTDLTDVPNVVMFLYHYAVQEANRRQRPHRD